MSDFQTALEGLTLNELYRVYANTVDVMQGMSKVYPSEVRTFLLSKLTIINNEIRKRESDEN